MNRHVHKRGVNKGYVSLLDQKKLEESKQIGGQVKPKNLFRGLIGGNAFTTLKGNRGTIVDSLWGQHIFMSFNNDDVELLEIAMKSSLADMTEVVMGGEFGSPHILGDLGFYPENKLAGQTEHLQDLERKFAVGKFFLSAHEWSNVDAKLSDIGHYSYSIVRRAIRGDTFGALALRANAFLVAKRMMECGVDPLVENAEGEDMIGILAQQYGYVSNALHHVMAHKDETQARVFPPSEMEEVEREEEYIISTLHNMLAFIGVLERTLGERIVVILKDRQAQRRAEMRKETLPSYNLWNASQHDKAIRHLEKCDEVKKYINERLETHAHHNLSHVSMAELVHMQHALTIGSGQHEPGSEAAEKQNDMVMRVSAKLSAKAQASSPKKDADSSAKSDASPSVGDLNVLLGLEGDQSEEKKPEDEDAKARINVDTISDGPILGVLRESPHESIRYR